MLANIEQYGKRTDAKSSINWIITFLAFILYVFFWGREEEMVKTLEKIQNELRKYFT